MGEIKHRKTGLGIAIVLAVTMFKVNAQPKLIVQVVVDQMRPEYLYRFKNEFNSDGGFSILLKDGFNYKNTHYNYIPTYTGPGHASISTGTTPKYHGIVANDWLDNSSLREVYCADDLEVRPIGTTEGSSRRSPKNLRSLTFADGIRLHTNYRGKSFGISVKDRGAIFPAGHFANGAFWLDESMHFVTSSYYMNELPKYFEKYNDSEYAMTKIKKGWKLELSEKYYSASLPDENPYEPKWNNESSSFPYDLKVLTEQKGLGILKSTPIANQMVLDMAIMLIEEEGLGLDSHTDFLGISFSSPDYVGHNWGVRSMEMHDMYIKLDAQLGELIYTLDKEVGRNNYILYLSSDHGASENPNHLKSNGYNANHYINADVVTELNDLIDSQNWEGKNMQNSVAKIINHNIYLNEWAKPHINEIAKIIEGHDPFLHVYTADEVRRPNADELALQMHQGYQSRFSGDLLFQLQPNCIFYGPYGSTHGSGYTYDTHVPFFILGGIVESGSSNDKINVTDIVDIIAEKSNLPFAPNSLVH